VCRTLHPLRRSNEEDDVVHQGGRAKGRKRIRDAEDEEESGAAKRGGKRGRASKQALKANRDLQVCAPNLQVICSMTCLASMVRMVRRKRGASVNARGNLKLHHT
jgi:hypothetical protein